MMKRMSYEDQISAITGLLKEEIQRLDTLPKEDAKKEARNGLMNVGIIDKNGNFTKPYRELRKKYVY